MRNILTLLFAAASLTGCQSPLQEAALPSDPLTSNFEAEEFSEITPEETPMNSESPSDLDRWKIMGGLVDAAEADDSPIKPVPFDEQEYWIKNAERKGMVALTSGVQYLPVREGRGLPIRSAPKVRVNYLVSRITGERVADSRLKNKGRPLEMEVINMPASWREVIPKMRIGDLWRVFVPADLARDIELPPGSYSFDIEMVKAFADVSDWYSEFSVDSEAETNAETEEVDTKVSLAPGDEND